MGLFENLVDKAKNYWMRFALRGVHYSDDHKRLNGLLDCESMAHGFRPATISV
jgi:hypothetical protein